MRVSPRERTLLESQAVERGCTLSAVMRAAIRQVPGPRVERELVVQIRRIGILLNQAMKHIHQGLPAEDDLQAALQNLSSGVAEILRRLA